MEVLLSNASENALAELLEGGVYKTPEEVIDKALENLIKAGEFRDLSTKISKDTRAAIQEIQSFGDRHCLSSGISLREMIELGRR